MIKTTKINLEACSICQLKCVTCPTASKEFSTTVGRGYLQFQSFKKLLHANPFLKEIELSNFGEIFLNPDIARIIEYAFEKKISLRADGGVNLNTVSSGVLEFLVKYKFKSITCSIDGASQHTYEQYRIKGNYEQVIDNIKKINEYKKKYRSAYPLLSWQFVIFGHNEHEIPKAMEIARSLNMDFRTKLNWDSSFSPVKNSNYVKEVSGLEIVSREDYKHRFGKGYAFKTCYQLWEKPQINWDGKILGCCWNYWGEFGENAFESGLIACMNNEKIRYARNMLSGKVESRGDIPCTTCENYKAMQSSNHWLTYNSFNQRIVRILQILYYNALLHNSLKRIRTFVGK